MSFPFRTRPPVVRRPRIARKVAATVFELRAPPHTYLRLVADPFGQSGLHASGHFHGQLEVVGRDRHHVAGADRRLFPVLGTRPYELARPAGIDDAETFEPETSNAHGRDRVDGGTRKTASENENRRCTKCYC